MPWDIRDILPPALGGRAARSKALAKGDPSFTPPQIVDTTIAGFDGVGATHRPGRSDDVIAVVETHLAARAKMLVSRGMIDRFWLYELTGCLERAIDGMFGLELHISLARPGLFPASEEYFRALLDNLVVNAIPLVVDSATTHIEAASYAPKNALGWEDGRTRIVTTAVVVMRTRSATAGWRAAK